MHEAQEAEPTGGRPAAHRPGSAGLAVERLEAPEDLLLSGHSSSALFQLQAAALLAEVRVHTPPSLAAAIAQDLADLRTTLDQLPPCKVRGAEAAGFIRELGLHPEVRA
ncbi:hypothetical protein HaLaN_27784, partial [Haematococcus lacustris]